MMTLLCAMVSTAWGEEVTIASFTASTYNSGNHNDWTVNNATYATANNGYYQLTYSNCSIVSPNIDWSQYTNITITIAGRKYGGPSADQGKISVSQGEKELASYSPSGTSIASSSAMSIEPEDGPITISCPGASSNKGCGVQSIIIKGKSSKVSIATLNSISPTSLTVGDADVFELDADFVVNENYTIAWSCNDNCLSVDDDGSYEAISAGTANVTVTVTPTDTNNFIEVSKSFDVTVSPAPATFDFPWSEDFSDNSLEGYVVVNGDSDTKIYEEDNNAGGTAPELLIGKNGGKFEVTINLKGNYGNMTLTFKANYNRVTVSATGGTVGEATFSNKSYNIPITVAQGTEKLTLTFTNSNSGNVRVDDFKLELGKQDPGLLFAETSFTVEPGTDFTAPTLTNPNNLSVVYSSSNEDLAMVDANTGEVIIGNNEGLVTITASFAGNSQYNEGSASYTIQIGTPHGTQENPYTVAEARSAIEAGTGVEGVYATGTVSKIVTPYNSQFGNITYDISADGTTTGDQLRVYRGKSYNGANFTSAGDIQVGDVVVIYGKLIKFNDIYEFAENNQLVTLYREVEPSITVNTTSIDIPAEGADGTIEVTFTNVDPELTEVVFYDADGTTETTCDWIAAEINGNNIEYLVDENEGEARTAYFKVYGLDNDGNNVYSELITITQAAAPAPSISVASTNVELTAAAGDGSIEVTYTRTEPYDVAFYEEDGETAAEYDWIEADFDDSNNIYYIVEENTSNEARTAYLKIVALGPDGDDLIYSDLITITQAAPAAPVEDFATLPFEFDGKKADIEGTTGLIQSGLGSDYKNSPYLKFDGTGDYVILKFNERPGKLTFDIQGNSFSGGTFTVQTSKDGVTYTDLENYTDLSSTQSEEFNNLGENVRYIKWIYTAKDAGNVALGNIKLEKYVAPQPYTLTITEADNAEIFAFYNDPDNNYPDIQNGDEVLSGSEVMISISASEGYEIENVTVTDGEGQAVQLTEKEEGISWTFIMPRSAVTVACTVIKERKKYVKITSTDDITTGKYLIVNEEGSVAFDGSLETLDAASNIQDVVIKNNVIKTDEPIYFTIDVNKRSIRSKSGKYIGQTSDSNGLKASDEEAYTNTISIGDDGNAVILSSGGAYLRFNKTTNAARFRYYKSESYDQQQPIQLYKAEDEPFTFTISDRATDGETCYATIADLGAGYFKVEGNVEVSTVVINENKQLSYPITFKENDVLSGQGAYLVKGAAGEYTFPTAEEGDVPDIGENMLISTGEGDVSADDMLAIAKAATNHEGDFKFYKLSLNGKGEAGSVGFYWGAAKGAKFNYTKAHQAFLAVPQTGESIESGDDVAAYLFDGGKTGIYNVMATESESNDDTYTLSGIRVENKQLPKGIYIKNGKKVVVK